VSPVADNYVTLKIRASDTAKPDLTDLKLQLGELGAKVETAKVDVDDREAGVKLLDLNARLADLNRKVANPRISLAQAARAEAQIAALELELDKLGAKTAKQSVELKGGAKTAAELAALDAELGHLGDKASRAGPGGLIGKIIGAAGGAAGNIPLLGGLPLPALIPALAALLPEVVAVGSGFAAAGTGAAAFGALAMPAVKGVETAYTGLSAAQQKYQDALAMYKQDPTTAHAKALHTAGLELDLMNDKIKKLPAAERDALKGVSGLAAEFGKLSKAFAPEAFKVFADGLKVVNSLLPAVTPMADAFANALDGLLRQLNGFVQSSGFQAWLKQFTSLIGPAVTAIGQGIGQVGIQFGKLLTIFSGKDVANGIGIAFGGIKLAIEGVILVVKGLKTAWDDLSRNPAFKRIAHDFAVAWDEISKTGKKKPDFSAITNAVKDAVSTAVSFLNKQLGPLIHSALQAANKWLTANASNVLVPIGKAIMQGLLKGLESQLPSLLSFLGKVATIIAEHKGPIEKDRLLLVPHGQAVMQGFMDGLASRMPDLRAQLAGISTTISGTQVPGRGQLGGGGGYAAGGRPQVTLEISGGSGLDAMMLTWMRQQVRVKGGGDVQVALGSGGSGR